MIKCYRQESIYDYEEDVLNLGESDDGRDGDDPFDFGFPKKKTAFPKAVKATKPISPVPYLRTLPYPPWTLEELSHNVHTGSLSYRSDYTYSRTQ